MKLRALSLAAAVVVLASLVALVVLASELHSTRAERNRLRTTANATQAELEQVSAERDRAARRASSLRRRLDAELVRFGRKVEVPKTSKGQLSVLLSRLGKVGLGHRLRSPGAKPLLEDAQFDPMHWFVCDVKPDGGTLVRKGSTVVVTVVRESDRPYFEFQDHENIGSCGD